MKSADLSEALYQPCALASSNRSALIQRRLISLPDRGCKVFISHSLSICADGDRLPRAAGDSAHCGLAHGAVMHMKRTFLTHLIWHSGDVMLEERSVGGRTTDVVVFSSQRPWSVKRRKGPAWLGEGLHMWRIHLHLPPRYGFALYPRKSSITSAVQSTPRHKGQD